MRRPLGSEPEIDARAEQMHVEIVGVGEDVCGECDDRTAEFRCEIGARRRDRAKVGIKIFTLQRPTFRKVNLGAAAKGPGGQILLYESILMRGREGVDKQRIVVRVGHGPAAGAVDQHRAKSHAHAGARGEQPIGPDRLPDGEPCCDAAGIDPRTDPGIVHIHSPEVGLTPENEMAHLKVEANLAATGKTPRSQALRAGNGDCGRAGSSKIAGRTKDGGCCRVRSTTGAPGIYANVKTRPLGSLRKTSCGQGQHNDTGSPKESLHLNLRKLLNFIESLSYSMKAAC